MVSEVGVLSLVNLAEVPSIDLPMRWWHTSESTLARLLTLTFLTDEDIRTLSVERLRKEHGLKLYHCRDYPRSQLIQIKKYLRMEGKVSEWTQAHGGVLVAWHDIVEVVVVGTCFWY